MNSARLRASSNFDKYLGLLSLVGEPRVMEVFKGILERDAKWMDNWKMKFLS